jgi:hypothetical protein
MGSRGLGMDEVNVVKILNYTMNLSSGRAGHLTCWRKLACAEVHRSKRVVKDSVGDSALG